MSELYEFIARGHRKIIDHYRWLRDTAKSDADRERFQQCMDEEEALLRRFQGQESADRRAA
jgi:hypothetical protein